jgi:hypothetical protein
MELVTFLIIVIVALAVWHYHTQIVGFLTKEADAAKAELNQLKGRVAATGSAPNPVPLAAAANGAAAANVAAKPPTS